MPRTLKPSVKSAPLNLTLFFRPFMDIMPNIPPLESRGNRPLKMSFEDQLKALVYFHLEEHVSAQHLLQILDEDDFAREHIAPDGGIKKSSFSEANNGRGLEQFFSMFQALSEQAFNMLPSKRPELGNLVGIDGSLIDATLSMHWADFRKNSKKAKVHVGFDLGRSIPRKVFLTDGKGAERPFVSRLLSDDETGVMDRGYQSHKRFDCWQKDNTLFLCRIKASTKKTVVTGNSIPAESFAFFDSEVLLGTPGVNQTERSLRLVGYEAAGVKYWIATNRRDLTADQIADAYKLRWEIENFFAWWKRHLKVYHLLCRSPHGLMVQILSGLITYLLMAIYCHENFQERVSIKRVRQLRTAIRNELNSKIPAGPDRPPGKTQEKTHPPHAKT